MTVQELSDWQDSAIDVLMSKLPAEAVSTQSGGGPKLPSPQYALMSEITLPAGHVTFAEPVTLTTTNGHGDGGGGGGLGLGLGGGSGLGLGGGIINGD